jgi:hypothetical protein
MRGWTLLAISLWLAGCAAPCEEGPAGTICTVVGSGEAGYGGDGGAAIDARLFHPIDVEFDDTGRMWILDWSNHRVRRVQQGEIRTVVGTQWPGDGPLEGGERDADGVAGATVSLNHPTDLVFNPLTGDAVLAAWHNHKLRWIGADDRVGILAGGEPGYTGDGGPAEEALLEYPHSVATDGEVVWFLDNGNGRIRRLRGGIAQTVAGTGESDFNGDGGASAVNLGLPDGSGEGFQPGGRIRFAEDGTLWIAEPLHGRVRRFDPATQEITTVLGGDDGVELQFPNDVLERDGLLYVLDRDAHVVLRVDLDDLDVEVVAGGNGEGYDGDGGLAVDATLRKPAGFGWSDGLWIADTENHVIRRVL